MVAEHQVDEIEGSAVVEPPPGRDVYLHANQFAFRPVLKLQNGETYRLLVSSTDVQHGLSRQNTTVPDVSTSVYGRWCAGRGAVRTVLTAACHIRWSCPTRPVVLA